MRGNNLLHLLHPLSPDVGLELWSSSSLPTARLTELLYLAQGETKPPFILLRIQLSPESEIIWGIVTRDLPYCKTSFTQPPIQVSTAH